MEEIKKYIGRFLKNHKMNDRYCMYLYEIMACKKACEENKANTICTVFDYGYAKGYRAALAEMKKGGAAV